MDLHSTISTQESNEAQKKILVSLTSQQKMALKNGAIGLGGLIAGAGLFNLFGNNNQSSGITTAQDEQDMSTENEVFELDSDLDLASGVTSEMSFDEAFASARSEVGAGGFFNWKGKSYNTYYKEEWDELTSEEQEGFYSKVDDQVDGSTVNEHIIGIDSDNDGNMEVTYKEVDGEMVIESVDLNDDGHIDIINDTDPTPLEDSEEIHHSDQAIQYDTIEAEPVYGAADISGDGIVDAVSVDINSDGMADAVVIDFNSDGVVDGYMINDDGDEDIDVLIIDDNQDGIDYDDLIEEIEEEVSMDSFIIIDEEQLENDEEVISQDLPEDLDYI